MNFPLVEVSEHILDDYLPSHIVQRITVSGSQMRPGFWQAFSEKGQIVNILVIACQNSFCHSFFSFFTMLEKRKNNP